MSTAAVPTEPSTSAEPVAVTGIAARRRPSPRKVLAIASLGAAVAFVDATIVNIAFPNIASSFRGTSISSLSWVLNAYNIVFAAFLVAAGRIADVVGRRRVFVLGLEVFTVGSLLCAIAPSAETLIAFRVIQALGAAMLVPASLALVMNAFPPERRAHGVALLSAVAAVAAGLGPSLGGLLVAASDWRLVFLVNLPIGVGGVMLARRQLVESRTPGRRRMPDLLGSLVFALAVALLVLAIVKGQEWGWSSGRIIGLFAGAAALAALFVWRCSWHRSPLVDLGLLRRRSFGVANAMTLLAAAGFYGYTLANVLFLTGVWRYSVLQAGLALTPGPFVAAAVAGPTSRLIQRIGHRPVLLAGGVIWGGGVLWLIERVGTTPAFLTQWLPGIVILGIGAGTLFPNLSGTAVAAAPGETFATATGLNSVARQVGAAFGVALVVAIIGTPSPLQALAAFDHAWTFGSACLFAAGIGCLLIGKVTIERAPALGDAARLLLRERPAELLNVTPVRRARRAITLRDETSTPTRTESTADFLGQVPIFRGLDPSLREALSSRTRLLRVRMGEWLFREGDAAGAMYVVRTGRLEVVDDASGAVIRELGRGDALGELALLTDAPRSASVRAARTTDLVAVDRGDFEKLLEASPAMSRALNKALAEQLRTTRSPASTARPRPTTVALVALDDHVSVAALARSLGAAIGRYVSAELLDRESATARSQGVEPASAYGPLLDRAEAGHDLVLLNGGALLPGSPWTEFCLQQADRILAVTSGQADPASVRTRPELRGCDLVGYDIDPARGALAELAAAVEPIESHLVRAAETEDIARLARRLTGRSIGIVLSGGGARAFSHIGVLEELTNAGVVIDRVLGVSMGAYVGALFAMGLSPDAVDARCFEEWVQRRPLGDYTLPRRALIRGERAKAMLQRTFGEQGIEELPLGFMCACSDLRSGRLVVSRHGPLWENVGFSMNLPIIAPPQVRGHELFIDGSLVDNLPVQVMADLGEGPVIASDVKTSFKPPTGIPRYESQRPRSESLPSLGETLARVLLLGSENTSEAARRYAHLTIRPQAEGVGFLEFHQLDAARQAGRAAVHAALSSASAASLE